MVAVAGLIVVGMVALIRMVTDATVTMTVRECATACGGSRMVRFAPRQEATLRQEARPEICECEVKP